MAYYSQGNGQAEQAIKSAKRILADNTDGCGQLYHDRTVCALLIKRNTPVQNLGMSPGIMLYGHVIEDPLPLPTE